MAFMSSRFMPAALVFTGAAAVSVPPAFAQDDAVVKVKDLNKKAIDSYENLDLEEARKDLTQALEICASEGLNSHPVKALSHLNLGIIFVGGFKQRDQGVRQFKRALEIDPALKIAKRLQNPELNAAFEEAKAGLGAPDVAAATPSTKPAETQPEPAKAAAADAPPSDVKGVYHQPITEANPGTIVPVKAAVEPALNAAKVILAYRPEGASDFLQRDMERDGSGWLAARIPQVATTGASVSYYIEARDKSGKALAGNGSAKDPHVVTLGVSARTEEPETASRRRGSKVGRIWVGLGVGMGGGKTKGTPEVNHTDLSSAARPIEFDGTASADRLHFAPEIGYVLRDDLMISLQGRLQLVTGATKVINQACAPKGVTDNDAVCKPSAGAIAVLAKVSYLLKPLAGFQPVLGGLVGGGEIRHLVDVNNSVPNICGDDRMSKCFDTVVSRWIFVGPSVGVVYDIGDVFSLTAHVNALVSVPKASINADLNVGVAAAF